MLELAHLVAGPVWGMYLADMGAEVIKIESLEAIELLTHHRGDAKVLAGGQSLVPLLYYRLASPRVVVDINGLPLSGAQIDDGRLRLGTLTRHATLEESTDIAIVCGILREAAVHIGNVRREP